MECLACCQDLLPQGNPLNALTSALSPVASLSIPIGLPTVAAPPSTSLSSASKTTSSTSTSTGTTSARPTSTSTPSQSSSSQLDSLSPSSLAASSTALLPIASPGGTDRTTTVFIQQQHLGLPLLQLVVPLDHLRKPSSRIRRSLDLCLGWPVWLGLF
ncbi:hypothetical protein BD779DRAFT_373437 [Infundibulicybe gibba]|nr:hypothetical protein BD779DRAFT_373437 [Infundibulicybe gibba]